MITLSGHQKIGFRGKRELSPHLPSGTQPAKQFTKDYFIKKTSFSPERPAILFASNLTKELELSDEPNRMHPAIFRIIPLS
jgi:hypothetical protein